MTAFSWRAENSTIHEEDAFNPRASASFINHNGVTRMPEEPRKPIEATVSMGLISGLPEDVTARLKTLDGNVFEILQNAHRNERFFWAYNQETPEERNIGLFLNSLNTFAIASFSANELLSMDDKGILDRVKKCAEAESRRF
jgi:hypothetical protein